MDHTSKDLESKEQMHKRVLFAVASVLGRECTLSLNSGEKFSGRLYTYVNDGLILKSCTRADTATEATTQVFRKGTFESFSFFNVTNRDTRKFKTDTEISNSRMGKNRNLQKWEGEGEGELLITEEGDTKFDQFTVNETKFGVTSNYREEYYTTSKVNEQELTEEQRIRAERVEREILSKAKTDEVIEDEEAAHSAVLGYGRFSDRKPPQQTPGPQKRFFKAGKEPERPEPKQTALVVEVQSFVPEAKSSLFTPLSCELPPDSVTSMYLDGAAIYTDSRLSSHEWTSDLIT
mmetsp:Transcript_9260/g.17690  ORF Transcript_9260/g.17690 Transcript_9260/m.17690 type:complete len:291 (-) Transcript_9260:245-1117(-)